MRNYCKLALLLLIFCAVNLASAAPSSTYSPAASVAFPISSNGVRRELVIPVDFPDQPGLRNRGEIFQQFFGHYPTGSLADYFAEVSYGSLILTGDVIGMPALNSSPANSNSTVNYSSYVRLPHSKSFYTGRSHGFDVNNFPGNMAGVFHDAIKALDASGFDFSPYVEPGTRRIDHAIVIFTGSSSAGSGNDTDFHASSYDLRYYFPGGLVTPSGFEFGNFTFCPELEADGSAATIGVCAHEIGHALGQSDLYDFSYQSSGVGYYDLMGYGLYGAGTGARPFHPSAATKALFGWLKLTRISSKTKRLKLKAVENSPSAIKLIPSGGDGSEYFILENRQFVGFDSRMSSVGLCPGLYIWHIDQAVATNFRASNLINSMKLPGGPSHPAISLVEADGDNSLTRAPISYGECGDAWKVGSTWKDSGRANARTWNGAKSGLSVKILAEKNGSLELLIKTTGRSKDF